MSYNSHYSVLGGDAKDANFYENNRPVFVSAENYMVAFDGERWIFSERFHNDLLQEQETKVRNAVTYYPVNGTEFSK